MESRGEPEAGLSFSGGGPSTQTLLSEIHHS